MDNLESQHERLLQDMEENEERLMDMSDFQLPPSTYWIFLVYGLAMLLPWNVFITASDFFFSRFAPYHNNDFQNYFSAFFNCSNLLSLLVILLVNKNQQKPSVVIRKIEIPLCINLVTFLFFAISALLSPARIDATVYFWVTIGFIVITGVTTSMLQASVVAEASQLLPKYMQAVMSGQGVAGVSVSLFSLLTVVFSSKNSAFYYFLYAIFVTLAALVGRHKQVSFKKQESYPLEDYTTAHHHKQQYVWNIVTRDIPGYILTVIYIYIITLALFPSKTVQITSVSGMDPVLFISLHFLLFNVGDWIGRTLPLWQSCQIFSSRLLLLFAFVRTGFIPAFLLYGTLFNSDLLFFVLLLLFSVSNGWLTSLVFMAAPQHQSQPALIGKTMSFFLVLGLALGGMTSFLFI